MKNETLTIDDVLLIDHTVAVPRIPPLTDYAQRSPGWTEVEYPFVDRGSERVAVGFWTGEPGSVALDPWAYTEVCSILSGRVAVVDQTGRRKDFGPGEAFVVPKGFVGTWITVEAATKLFVAIA